MSKINLVSLSGEQLWPTIHSIAHFGDQIENLFILHTDDDAKSARPARSILNFVASWNKNIKVILPKLPIKNNSAEISHALHQWMEAYPNQNWVINATGGTKLMFLGVLDFVNLANVQIIYRDLTGKPGQIWQSVSRMEALGFLEAKAIDIPNDSTDAIPVETLVKTIWGDGGNFTVDFGPPLPNIDLEKTTKIAALNEWNFQKAFKAMNYPATAPSGQLFEQYVASILHALGVKNLACNAVRKSLELKNLSEIDIIANHKGALTIIDCKMRSEEDEKTGKAETLFDQIRKAHQVGNELGGLGAKIILLRPNRTFSSNEESLAKSYRITVFDAPKITKIISHFADHFQAESIPQNLINLQNIIQESQSNQIYPGMGPAPFQHEWDPATRQSGIMDINRYLVNLQNDLNQNWSIFSMDNLFYLDFPIPDKWLLNPKSEIENSILDYLHSFTKRMADLRILNLTRKRCRVEMATANENNKALIKLFQNRFGKSLFNF